MYLYYFSVTYKICYTGGSVKSKSIVYVIDVTNLHNEGDDLFLSLSQKPTAALLPLAMP